MTETVYDVTAIGNAIVDIIGRCDDAFLTANGAPKGHMRLVDADTSASLYAKMGPAVEISGGSAANTVVGLASFGGRAAFIGKIASDEFGWRPADVALAHPGHARRRAHHEHLPRHLD